MSEWLSLAEGYAHVLDQEINPSVAREKIIECFFDGKLPAKMIGYTAEGKEYGDVFFQKLQLFENVHPWFELDFETGAGRLPITGVSGGIAHRASFSGVQMSRKHLLALWPAPSSPFPPAATSTRKGVGGAPTKYDWPRAAGFMAKFVIDNDPQRPEALKELQKWFQDRGQEPDKRDLERFIKELFPESEN